MNETRTEIEPSGVTPGLPSRLHASYGTASSGSPETISDWFALRPAIPAWLTWRDKAGVVLWLHACEDPTAVAALIAQALAEPGRNGDPASTAGVTSLIRCPRPGTLRKIYQCHF